MTDPPGECPLPPWQRVLDAAPYGMAVIGLDERCLWANPRLEALLGRPVDELVGRPLTGVVDPEDVAAVRGAVAEALAGPDWPVTLEVRTRRPDGTLVWLAVDVTVVRDDDGEPHSLLAHCADVTRRKRLDVHRAHHDPLTGLPNRLRLVEELDARLDTAAGTPGLAVAVVDLDEFKLVNDSLGHDAGDTVLAEAATRLRALAAGRPVARLGADEFAVVLPDDGEEGGVRLAEQVLDALRTPVSVGGHAVTLRASVGVAAHAAGVSSAELLRNADLAMYAAKAAGTGRLAVYNDSMLSQSVERLELENHLRRALERQELRLAYQPVVDTRTRRVVGVEALLRWHSPTLGVVPPDRFIPVAEQTGMIVEIGEWVLHQACRQAARRIEEGRSPVRMAVNMSVAQLHDPQVVDKVGRALRQADLPAQLLVLEVTESMLVTDDDAATERLRRLVDLGVSIAVDDFGTGHSSFGRLRTLPVSTVKVDKSFISEIDGTGVQAPIVAAVVAMAAAMGLDVVAEGVETPAQLQALTELQCAKVQGFLLSRPVPAERLHDVIDAQEEVGPSPGRTDASTRLMRTIARLAELEPGPAAEAVVRPALAELARLLAVDAVFVARQGRDGCHVDYAFADGLDVVEGGTSVTTQALCRRAFGTGPLPDGVGTFATARFTGPDGEVTGGLCVAAAGEVPLADGARTLLDVLAQLIGAHVARGYSEPGRLPR